MAFREQLIAACTAKATTLGRKLTSLEIVGVACECHAKATKERRKAGVLPDAEQVYALYPRKVGREDALTAISGSLKKHDLAYLLDKTNQFAEAVKSWPSSYRYFQDGGDRCPNPATWYRQGRFADDPSTWRRHGAHTAAPSNRVSPPEPMGWQAAFPDFLDRDKHWSQLQPAQQAYIVANMATASTFTALPKEVDATQALREA